jgi:glycosyltransferase involved in cell wall biosynthesis
VSDQLSVGVTARSSPDKQAKLVVPDRQGELVDDVSLAYLELELLKGKLQEASASNTADRLRLAKAEDRAADLEWKLNSIKRSRGYRLMQLLAQIAFPRGQSRLRLIALLPLNALRVIRFPVKPTQRPVPSARPATLISAGLDALDERDYDKAVAEADAILVVDPRDDAALELKQTAHWKRGDVSATIGTSRRRRAARDSAQLALQQRNYVGRSRELDPRWLPRVPGPPQPVEPRDGVIMHLLKESIPYHANGFTTRSRYTAQCQREAGLDPFVVTSLGFPRKDGFTEFQPVEVIEGTPYHRIDLGPDYPCTGAHDMVLSTTAWMAARIGRQKCPSVIHASTGYRGFETALTGLALRAHLERPLVYDVRSFHETTWTSDVEIAERGEHYEARLAAEVRSMRAADLVVTIADGMRDEIIGRGIPSSKVLVVPNGVNADRFTPTEASPALRQKYGLDGKAVIGYVSNLDHPREGQEILIEATARLRARSREVVCLLVGDGKRRAELEELAHSAAPGAVIFTGTVAHEQVRDFYALIDIFVVPRVDERAARLVTPLKPFEAMAMRLPMIVSDLPALAEVAKPGERGLAFTPGDADALARAVETFLDNPEHASALAEAGRRWVLAERTWAANGKRYQEIYRDVIDRWEAGDMAAGGLA